MTGMHDASNRLVAIAGGDHDTTLALGASFDALLLPESPFLDRAALRRPQPAGSRGVAAPLLG